MAAALCQQDLVLVTLGKTRIPAPTLPQIFLGVYAASSLSFDPTPTARVCKTEAVTKQTQTRRVGSVQFGGSAGKLPRADWNTENPLAIAGGVWAHQSSGRSQANRACQIRDYSPQKSLEVICGIDLSADARNLALARAAPLIAGLSSWRVISSAVPVIRNRPHT